MIDGQHWQPLDRAAGLFAAERWSPRCWHWRSTALLLRSGEILVVSPIPKLDEEAHRELEGLGPPALLLAPNHYHYLGLAEYCERFPDCSAISSDVAAPRLARKQGVAIEPLERLGELLPDHVELLLPDGLKNGEVWLRVATNRGIAWVVSDAFFNLAKNPRGFMGLACRMTGTTPGLRIGKTFKIVGVGERKPYRDWLRDRLQKDQPRLLIPGHGEVWESDDLSERLGDLVTARL